MLSRAESGGIWSTVKIPINPSLVARVIDPFLLTHHSLALGFFNWTAQQPGYSHDSISYHSIFKTLSLSRQFSAMDALFKQYIEQELAKKRGKNLDDEEEVENELKRVEDELYKIPHHLKNILSFTKNEEGLKQMAKELNHLLVLVTMLNQGKADKLPLIKSCWNDFARESVIV